MKQLRALLPYFRPYAGGMALGLLLVVISNAFQTAGPYLLKLAIDVLGDPDVTRAHVAGYAALIVAVAVLGGAARYGMRELLNGISRRMEVDLRHDLFRHLLRLDASFYNRHRTGDLMSLATNDTQAVRQAVGPAVMYTVNTLVGFAFAVTLMLWISPKLTALALIPMVLLPPVVLAFGRMIHDRFERIQEQFAALSTMVQENLSGVRIVRAYGQEEPQAREFEVLNSEYIDRNMDLVKVSGLFHPLLSLLTGIAMVIVLWVGGREVVAGAISVGDFVAFGFYLLLLAWPMIALGWVVNLYQRGAASMGRINRVLETEPRIAPPAEPVRLERVRGEIEFDGVSFHYPGTERPVLTDVSFRVEPGQRVALVGPTGSGKSTLVSLIPRLHDPDEGEVRLDGIPLSRLDPVELRSAVGMVPQDPFLFSETILENIRLGLDEEGAAAGAGEGPIGASFRLARGLRSPEGEGGEEEGAGAGAGDGGSAGADEAASAGAREPSRAEEWAATRAVTTGEDPEEAVLEAARIAQLHDSIVSFPRGYRTHLGERGINLSGGQKQRATLARAVARDPAILILDDALSAVDTRTEARILADLEQVMEGRTSFIISHRVTAVMDADLILVLDEGRVVERGTHQELIARRGTYATLLRRQMLEEDLEGETVASGA